MNFFFKCLYFGILVLFAHWAPPNAAQPGSRPAGVFVPLQKIVLNKEAGLFVEASRF